MTKEKTKLKQTVFVIEKRTITTTITIENLTKKKKKKIVVVIKAIAKKRKMNFGAKLKNKK